MKDDLVDSELITVLELRDRFAMAAIEGLCARGDKSPAQAAEVAYVVADEMLEARKEKGI